MPTTAHPILTTALILACSLTATSQDRATRPAEPLGVIGSIPIREVTIFKDGHAFVVHEGTKPVNAAGDVVMDELPQPVLGTFWPYAAPGSAKLAAVRAGRRRVIVERTALDVRGLLEANPGAEVTFVDAQGRHAGVVVGVPTRSAGELARTEPPGAGEMLPQKGGVILVRTAEGVRAAPFDGIREVTFRGAYKTALEGEEFRNLLTLDLDWGGAAPAAEARVGMGYLQKGLRWIPSYHVAIDGAGKATVKLEATIVNDLADLDGVSANLVIGVPTFDFRGMLDPISLQSVLVQVARQQEGDRQFLSNAIMGQIVYAEDRREATPAGAEPEVTGAAQNEDLYVFTVKGLTLRRGERMVVPVAEMSVSYEDVYTLDYELAPPPEMWGQSNMTQQEELAKKLGGAKVFHKLRIRNTSAHPFTTAPALIIRDGKLLAQSTMTYTSAGGDVDLPVTAAVDLKAKRTDQETGRKGERLRWNGSTLDLWRVDLEGTIEITSFKDKPVTIEISREVIGLLDSTSPGGTATQLSLEEFWARSGAPRWWWGWYSWPAWWASVNGIGRAEWTVTIEPKKQATVSCKWHYFRG